MNYLSADEIYDPFSVKKNKQFVWLEFVKYHSLLKV